LVFFIEKCINFICLVKNQVFMTTFTDSDILLLDGRFALEHIPFHARPFHAAKAILGKDFLLGINEKSQLTEIQRAYARLVPEVEFTWPEMGTGLAAAMDRVRKITVGVVYGTIAISVEKGLGFANREEWALWCRNDPKIAAQSAFAFADIYDLVYGINAMPLTKMHRHFGVLRRRNLIWSRKVFHKED
jgi:hypothetical protein